MYWTQPGTAAASTLDRNADPTNAVADTAVVDRVADPLRRRSQGDEDSHLRTLCLHFAVEVANHGRGDGLALAHSERRERNDPAGREQPGRFFSCGCALDNAEQASFDSTAWLTVANATLNAARAPSRSVAAATLFAVPCGRGGWSRMR